MTQSSRTTESINKDYAGIREIMHQIKELTVPDRATVALGLIGHLATLMNRSQMSKLMQELQEEAARVQDVPPSRARDQEDRNASHGSQGSARRDDSGSDAGSGGGPAGGMQAHGAAGEGAGETLRGADPSGRSDSLRAGSSRAADASVGQSGRGEFRSDELL